MVSQNYSFNPLAETGKASKQKSCHVKSSFYLKACLTFQQTNYEEGRPNSCQVSLPQVSQDVFKTHPGQQTQDGKPHSSFDASIITVFGFTVKFVCAVLKVTYSSGDAKLGNEEQREEKEAWLYIKLRQPSQS